MNRDEVIAQRPEDVRLVVPVFHTSSACSGSVTAYLLRRIAYRAGAYAPGIQENLFYELNVASEGGTIERVQRWFGSRDAKLNDLGYRLQCRHVAAPTPAILDWVKTGRGYRGALLPTSYLKLHPTAGDEVHDHAVGVTIDRLEAKSNEELVMIDPWPAKDARDRGKVSAALEAAHRERLYHALVYYWVGWS